MVLCSLFVTKVREGVGVTVATEALENYTENVSPIVSILDETSDVQVEDNESLHNLLGFETISVGSISRCSEQQDQIENANIKIKHLEEQFQKMKEEMEQLPIFKTDLQNIKEQIKEKQILEDQKDDLQSERSSLSSTCRMSLCETTEFRKLTEELHRMNNEIEYLKRNQKSLPGIQSAPSAPPPPPPPPPPFLLAPSNQLIISKSLNKNEGENKTEENSRPVISLEDILKVKLKKPTEQAPSRQPSNQPVVTLDILQEVKLRPVAGSRAKNDSNMQNTTSSALQESSEKQIDLDEVEFNMVINGSTQHDYI